MTTKDRYKSPPSTLGVPLRPFPFLILILNSYFAAMQTSPRPWYRPSLTTQIFLGLILGGAIGYFRPTGATPSISSRHFLNLIKSIIAPLVFSTIVVASLAAAR